MNAIGCQKAKQSLKCSRRKTDRTRTGCLSRNHPMKCDITKTYLPTTQSRTLVIQLLCLRADSSQATYSKQSECRSMNTISSWSRITWLTMQRNGSFSRYQTPERTKCIASTWSISAKRTHCTTMAWKFFLTRQRKRSIRKMEGGLELAWTSAIIKISSKAERESSSTLSALTLDSSIHMMKSSSVIFTHIDIRTWKSCWLLWKRKNTQTSFECRLFAKQFLKMMLTCCLSLTFSAMPMQSQTENAFSWLVGSILASHRQASLLKAWSNSCSATSKKLTLSETSTSLR